MVNPANIGFYQIPEHAIEAFEDWSGLHVALHDVEMQWTPFVPSKRFIHDHAPCAFLKGEGYERACMRFEIDQLRPWLQVNSEGGLKICHAGMLEWAVPVLREGHLSAVLFAGLRRPGRGVVADIVDDRPTAALKRWPVALVRLETVTPKRTQLYLEGLRQLAARLHAWMKEHMGTRERKAHNTPVDPAKRRQLIIEQFIAERYSGPVTIQDLANTLHLSPDRTVHLVKEVCGETFGTKIQRYRLRKAAGMLWQTEFSVTRIAMDAGFGDISNFHRAFRRVYGLTPLQFRRQGGIR